MNRACAVVSFPWKGREKDRNVGWKKAGLIVEVQAGGQVSSCFQLVTRPGFIYLRGGIGAGPGGSGRISGARGKSYSQR